VARVLIEVFTRQTFQAFFIVLDLSFRAQMAGFIVIVKTR